MMEFVLSLSTIFLTETYKTTLLCLCLQVCSVTVLNNVYVFMSMCDFNKLLSIMLTVVL